MPKYGGAGQVAAPADFHCNFCLRPAECRGLPTVDEEGNPLSTTDILEEYNERRYAHYLNDFDNQYALKKHLEDRVRYFNAGGTLAQVELDMGGVRTTLDWWTTALRARQDITPKQRELDEAKAALRRKMDAAELEPETV